MVEVLLTASLYCKSQAERIAQMADVFLCLLRYLVLETMIGTKGVKLSGGQAQRTAAARMLVRDAELLIFDDCPARWTWRRNIRCGSASSQGL